jgi:hypothetical protein
MTSLGRLFTIVRNFLFSRTNREFLIFLFFLSLSGVFWLLLTLNETYEREMAVPIHIADIPSDIMLTSDETDTVKVVIRDRGIILLTYIYGEALKNVSADFKTYDQSGGNGSISAAELAKIVQGHLAASSKIVSVKPDKLRFFYNTGASKRVSVRWRGRVIPEQLYFLSHVAYDPDSVTIYASEERLDSIRMVFTEQLNHVGFRDTLAVDCRLRRIEGVKMIPDHVKVTFYTDVLTEESVDGIPVVGINLPPGKVLRTFPARVSVKFVTGINVYRTLKPSDFTVVADYDELRSQPSEKCNLTLQRVPQGINHPKLVTPQVDYLIEEADQ